MAPGALALVMMTPPQLAGQIGRHRLDLQQRRDQHLVPARAQARRRCVRLSACGRVTTRRMVQSKKPGRRDCLQARGRHRRRWSSHLCASPAAAVFMRRAAVRLARSGRGNAARRRSASHGRRSACGRSRRARRGTRARRQARSRCRHDRCARAVRACACRSRAPRCRSRPARPPAGIHRASQDRRRVRVASPSRFRPASASMVASTSPSSSLRSRVSTLPRSGTTLQIGPRALGHRLPAQRGGAERRALRQIARAMRALRLMNTSRASSRARQAASISPAGSTVGMSLAECTARSMRPSSSASSISLVNSPLPPTSASGRSWMRVAGGADDDDLDRLLARAQRRRQPRAHHARLHQRQRAAARADAQGRRWIAS